MAKQRVGILRLTYSKMPFVTVVNSIHLGEKQNKIAEASFKIKINLFFFLNLRIEMFQSIYLKIFIFSNIRVVYSGQGRHYYFFHEGESIFVIFFKDDIFCGTKAFVSV